MKRPTWSNGLPKRYPTLSDYANIDIDRATAILADCIYKDGDMWKR